jgi:hypothetical protein
MSPRPDHIEPGEDVSVADVSREADSFRENGHLISEE